MDPNTRLNYSQPQYIETDQNGILGPVLVFTVQTGNLRINEKALKFLKGCLSSQEIPELPSIVKTTPKDIQLDILQWIYTICKETNWPVFQHGTIDLKPNSILSGMYTLPTQKNARFLPFNFTVFLLNCLKESEEKTNLTKLSENLKSYQTRFKQAGLKGSNQRWVHLELHRRGKTIKHITSGILQINSGKDTRFIRGTMTDQVKRLFTEIQTDKVATARLLRIHGLPTVTHERVYTLDQAIKTARRLGYPLVLKPYNGAQDRHVYVNIRNQKELIKIYRENNFPSEDGLLEVFIEGPIYRILMIQNCIIYCSLKQHEYIEGDNKKTISQLIQEHCDVSYKTKYKLKAKFDYDQIIEKNQIKQMLLAKNMTLSTVLTKGQTVRITRIPGMSSGSIVHYIKASDLPDIFVQRLTYISQLFGGAPIGIDAIGENMEDAKFNEVNFGPQLSYKTGSYYRNFLDAEFP